MEPVSQNESGISEYFEGYQQLEKEGIEENLNKTRNAIFVVAGVALLGGIILYSLQGAETADLVLNLVLTGIYLILGLLTKKFPMTCVVIALILFAGTWILNIAVGGAEQIFRGIIMKAIIIYYLIKGIGYAKEAEELRTRMNSGS